MGVWAWGEGWGTKISCKDDQAVQTIPLEVLSIL